MKKLTVLIGTILSIMALSSDPALSGTDGDGVPDATDNCICVPNPFQEDDDGDGVGNVCDNCPNPPDVNPSQRDSDADGIGNICDASPYKIDIGYGPISGTSTGSTPTGGVNNELLAWHIFTLHVPGSSDNALPPGPVNTYLFSVFDTGSAFVVLNPYDADYLKDSGGALDINIWGFSAVDPGLTRCIPIRFPEAEDTNVNLLRETDETKPTLIGGPLMNQAIAWVDYTTIVQRIYPFGTFRFPLITFFEAGDSGIPTPLFWADIQGSGIPPTPPPQGADRGERYLINNMTFKNGSASVTSPAKSTILPPTGQRFLYDTGNTATQIGRNLATALGIDWTTLPSGNPTIGRRINGVPTVLNGYLIEKVEIEAADGSYTYVINNPLVFVFPSATIEGIDANIGSNYFEKTQVVFDGPEDRIGFFKGVKEQSNMKPSAPKNLRILDN